MPMLEACIPDGALPPEALGKLLARLTDLLRQHEGVDPANQAARALARVSAHRPAAHASGSAAPEPRYRFVCQVSEGQYDDKRPGRHRSDDTSRGGCGRRQPPPDPSDRVGCSPPRSRTARGAGPAGSSASPILPSSRLGGGADE
jgi:hypothetical protein